jgi:hypothetical protein
VLAVEVVPFEATPPVAAAPVVLAPVAELLELLELQPANTRQAAMATRRRIMNRG